MTIKHRRPPYLSYVIYCSCITCLGALLFIVALSLTMPDALSRTFTPLVEDTLSQQIETLTSMEFPPDAIIEPLQSGAASVSHFFFTSLDQGGTWAIETWSVFTEWLRAISAQIYRGFLDLTIVISDGYFRILEQLSTPPPIKIPEITIPHISLPSFDLPDLSPPAPDLADQRVPHLLDNMEPAAGLKLAEGETTGVQPPPESNQSQVTPAAFRQFDVEMDLLETDAVLIPAQSVVISSSRDGRITEIPFKNGDTFNSGDVLLAYDCSDLQTQRDLMKKRLTLAELRMNNSERLFKLDLLSEFEKAEIKTEAGTIEDEIRIIDSRMRDCTIRAEFDGQVTALLSNPGEYTRTDRVLMEVAATDTLEAQMLIPSTWLRWLDKGAEFALEITETQEAYGATLIRIGGQVDPVNQTVQVTARLTPYEDRLLPGMSGIARFNVDELRASGFVGYLEKPR